MSALDLALDTALENHRINPLGWHFAKFLCRLAGEDSLELAWAAALVSKATDEGHVCLNLQQALVLPGRMGDVSSVQSWSDRLFATSVVGRPGDYKPLILDGERLYLCRYWQYEEQVATSLRLRSGAVIDDLDEGKLKQGLARYFPGKDKGTTGQMLAAATALLRRFCVISGGPGTGKTTTVVRILALLLEQSTSQKGHLRIALAAPTGKAAARLQESLQHASQGLGLDDALVAKLPEEAVTLHRLLGSIPGKSAFRYNQKNRLPLDVLILDEASMVDLGLMAKLLQALPTSARLIVLGDKDQLASVDAGAVLGDICEAAGEVVTSAFAEQLLQLTGQHVPTSDQALSEISDSVALLQHSYRFSNESRIGQLAAGIKLGDVRRVIEVLTETSELSAEVAVEEAYSKSAVSEGYRHYLQLLTDGATESDIFNTYNTYRVLCAVRRGPRGVVGLNQDIEATLQRESLISEGSQWYAGRPVLVTQNAYGLRLYNGDVGIVLPRSGGSSSQLRVCFPTSDGGYRWIAPSRMPPHETAFAMTVHKSQGSEFDRVTLVLPDQDVPVLCRELVYTAVTRAKKSFVLAGSSALFAQAVKRPLVRSSGLKDALIKGS